MPNSLAEQTIVVRKERGVAWIKIDNPPINLLDMRLSMELDAVSRALEADPDIHVLVFESANPDYFLSHADLTVLQKARDAGAYSDTSRLGFFQQILERFRTMPKISIAQVEGRARGGGGELVLAMDMAFASPAARFSQMEILLGINPGGGGAQYLARKAGRARALELCVGGAEVSAEQAVDYGYVNRVLPKSALAPFVRDLAYRIASFPPAAIARNKANIVSAEGSIEAGLLEASRSFGELVSSAEFDRRVAAFLAAGGQTAKGARGDLAAFATKLS
jgi:enoyl-CoA hydratase/carnithine racemase